MAFDVWGAKTVCLKLFSYFDCIGGIGMFAMGVIFVTGARLWMWIRLTRICFEAAIGQDLGPSWKRHVRVRSYLTRGLSVL
jgi:hypothetical protein